MGFPLGMMTHLIIGVFSYGSSRDDSGNATSDSGPSPTTVNVATSTFNRLLLLLHLPLPR
jgi:hypothetical protein